MFRATGIKCHDFRMLRQNLLCHASQAWFIYGTQAFAMDNAHTVESALNRLGQKSQQNFPGGGLIHVVQIYLVRRAEMAAAESSEDAFLITGPQELKVFCCF